MLQPGIGKIPGGEGMSKRCSGQRNVIQEPWLLQASPSVVSTCGELPKMSTVQGFAAQQG